MRAKAKHNQSLLDVSIQLYGSAEKAFALAGKNGVSISGKLLPGDVLEFDPEVIKNNPVLTYYRQRGLVPATAIQDAGQAFEEQFSETFE